MVINTTITATALVSSIIATIIVAIWIIVPIRSTVIPYSRNKRDESVLISRIVSRVVILLFFIRMSLANWLILFGENHGSAIRVTDPVIIISTITLIYLTIKTHPDGIRGL